jgi:hypothetical protein
MRGSWLPTGFDFGKYFDHNHQRMNFAGAHNVKMLATILQPVADHITTKNGRLDGRKAQNW